MRGTIERCLTVSNDANIGIKEIRQWEQMRRKHGIGSISIRKIEILEDLMERIGFLFSVSYICVIDRYICTHIYIYYRPGRQLLSKDSRE